MSDNKIIKYDKNIFARFFNWLKSFFPKNKSYEESVIKENNKTSKIDKDKYIKLYNDAKSRKIDVSSLSHEDISILNDMIDEEMKIKEEKLNTIKENNRALEHEIEKMKEEYNSLLEKNQNKPAN